MITADTFINMEDSLENSVDYEHFKPVPFDRFRLIKDLMNHGAEINAYPYGIIRGLCSESDFNPEILDILFKKGINIDSQSAEFTFLRELISNNEGHINYTRWLIRHGANTNILSTEQAFARLIHDKRYELFELLVRAGIKPPEKDIAGLYRTAEDDISEEIPECSSVKCNEERLTFMKWNRDRHAERQHQEADLLEFSDETLNVFPEDTESNMADDEKLVILAFLRQPCSLKWRCRQSIRQNLVSHSPSVLKSISLPSALKRYILCHEL